MGLCNRHVRNSALNPIPRCLLITAVMIPLLVAFQDEREIFTYTVIDMVTNSMFALNIIVTFLSAFYDDEHNLIAKHKVVLIY